MLFWFTRDMVSVYTGENEGWTLPLMRESWYRSSCWRIREFELLKQCTLKEPRKGASRRRRKKEKEAAPSLW